MSKQNGNTSQKKNTKPVKGAKTKKKKRKIRENPPLAIFLSFIAICFFTVCVMATYVLANAIATVNGELIIDLDEYKANQNQTSFIYAYDKDMNVVELAKLHGEENRIWVDLDDISPHMKNAFIALEDERFYEHGGVDWRRTIGVIVKPSNFGQGGSTITQQLIKNYTKENDVTIIRKFNEILTALNLEKHYKKDTIIEAYLNTLYLGSGCYGVQTASEKYFGKDVSELNAAECAVIASITQAPTKYNPLLNPEDNRDRQLWCLKKMWEEGYLTKSEYEEACDFELVFTNSENYVSDEEDAPENEEEVINSFYVDYVIQCVRDDLMTEKGYSKQQATDAIYYGGLKIYAAVDLEIQSELENVYVNRINFPDLESDDEVDENGDPVLVQSAMTIMDYEGRVVAIVGQAGPKLENRGLNRAANSFRQPGSTIKPISTYAPAIEYDYIHFSSMIKDYAITINGNLWPHNVNQTYGTGGNVTVQYAIQESHNTVPARIISQTLTPQASYDFLANRFHLTQLDPVEDVQLAPLATGALFNGSTTVEMAAAYAPFGNGGMYYYPYSYYKVTNSKGDEIILSNEQPRCERAISEETADIMCELLQTVNTSHYGDAPNVRDFQIMAKTGTTTNNTNRWFCAGTPYYVAAVWVGFDIPETLDVNVNPGGEIFFTVFDEIHEGLDEREFPKSNGTVKKTYCRQTGLIAGPTCSSTGTGWYKMSNLPATCTSCTSSGSEIVDDIIEGVGNEINDFINDVL